MPIYHKHHIIPKHMGGSNDPSNLVTVTVEEHANLHKQLWEDLGHIEDFYAWKGLSQRISIEDKILLRCSLGGKIGGKKLKGIAKTESHKKAISKSLFGKKQTEQHIENVKNSLSGEKSNLSKVYRIIDPNGVEYIVKGLSYFCRIYELSKSNMCAVAKGIRKQHKGWRCEYYVDL